MIGIFDSGVGGLSIFTEILRLEPKTSIIYLADSLNFPYGEKTQEELLKITESATERLLDLGANTIVVACNSATVSTINLLRKSFPLLTFIGLEPAVKPAFESGRYTKIGLLATKKTVSIHTFDTPGVGVFKYHNAKLIDMIENNYGAITDNDLEEAIKPFLDNGCQAVVLGCSHFYFIKNRLKKLFPEVVFFEPSEAVAKRTLDIDKGVGLGERLFLVSGDPNKFTDFLENVVGYRHANIRKI